MGKKTENIEYNEFDLEIELAKLDDEIDIEKEDLIIDLDNKPEIINFELNVINFTSNTTLKEALVLFDLTINPEIVQQINKIYLNSHPDKNPEKQKNDPTASYAKTLKAAIHNIRDHGEGDYAIYMDLPVQKLASENIDFIYRHYYEIYQTYNLDIKSFGRKIFELKPKPKNLKEIEILLQEQTDQFEKIYASDALLQNYYKNWLNNLKNKTPNEDNYEEIINDFKKKIIKGLISLINRGNDFYLIMQNQKYQILKYKLLVTQYHFEKNNQEIIEDCNRGIQAYELLLKFIKNNIEDYKSLLSQIQENKVIKGWIAQKALNWVYYTCASPSAKTSESEQKVNPIKRFFSIEYEKTLSKIINNKYYGTIQELIEDLDHSIIEKKMIQKNFYYSKFPVDNLALTNVQNGSKYQFYPILIELNEVKKIIKHKVFAKITNLLEEKYKIFLAPDLKAQEEATLRLVAEDEIQKKDATIEQE